MSVAAQTKQNSPRADGRALDQLRNIRFELDVSRHAEGSCLVKFGHTHVLCTASVETKVPGWMKGSGKGWVTAEYGMLPRSTGKRMDRESVRGQQSGRTQEIQRLIGRSLRAVVDASLLGEIQIKVDCDVIQADGGTRTAAITGGYIALYQACQHLLAIKALKTMPLTDSVAAVSCGLHQGNVLIDPNYDEDSALSADANFVMTGSGQIVEVQCSGESTSITETQFFGLHTLAKSGLQTFTQLQKQALGQ